MLIFDVGCFRGEDATVYRELGHKIVSVEPVPCEVLTIMVELSDDENSPFGAWRAVYKALVPEDYKGETIPISVHAERPELNSTVRDYGNKQEVPVVKLSQLYEEFGKPDLIKMDIEGAELNILRSLKECPASYMMVELSDINLIYELVRLGYREFRISDQNNRQTWPQKYQNNDGSGPFGDDLKVEWTDAKKVIQQYKAFNPGNYWADLHARK